MLQYVYNSLIVNCSNAIVYTDRKVREQLQGANTTGLHEYIFADTNNLKEIDHNVVINIIVSTEGRSCFEFPSISFI